MRRFVRWALFETVAGALALRVLERCLRLAVCEVDELEAETVRPLVREHEEALAS